MAIDKSKPMYTVVTEFGGKDCQAKYSKGAGWSEMGTGGHLICEGAGDLSLKEAKAFKKRFEQGGVVGGQQGECLVGRVIFSELDNIRQGAAALKLLRSDGEKVESLLTKIFNVGTGNPQAIKDFATPSEITEMNMVVLKWLASL